MDNENKEKNIKVTNKEIKDVSAYYVTASGVTASTETGALVVALAKAQLNFTKLTKDAVNPFFKSRFLSLDNIISSTRDALSSQGLVLMQFIQGTHELVTVVSRIMHSSGQWIESSVSSKPAKMDVQQQGSISSYLKRYSMSSLLGINSEIDDDGNSSVYISPTQVKSLEALVIDEKDLRIRLLSTYKKLELIPIAKYETIVAAIKKTIEVKK